MRVATALIGLAVAATGIALVVPSADQSAPSPLADDVSKMETQIAARLSTGLWPPRKPPGALASTSTPDRARPLDQYVRFYALATVRSEEDLPFTTLEDSSDVSAEISGPRIVGVLVSPDIVERPAGIAVSHTGRLPKVVHGGCSVVNVIYHPQVGRLVSAWCNVPTPY